VDLERFSTKELLLAAIRSEIESKIVYDRLANGVRNAFLKDRLLFIADEERKHREYLEGLYAETFKGEKLEVPMRSPVPLPEVKISMRYVPASTVMVQAMEAEKAASEFYKGLAPRFKGDDMTRSTIEYLSSMEMGHYRLLELEKERLDQEEVYEIEWELMHAGP